MLPVYCISGLGADERVYSQLQLSGCELHFIKWIAPLKNESIESYAQRLALQITHKEPVLMGVSFGGMLAVEIGKIISCKKIILISSIKTAKELPLWMKLTGQLQLNKLIQLKRKESIFSSIEYYFLGPETAKEKQLMKDFKKNTDTMYINWAIDKILNWKNKTELKNIVHLLGAKDKFFSVKRSKPDYIIAEGTHFMVYNRAAEISAIIQYNLSAL